MPELVLTTGADIIIFILSYFGITLLINSGSRYMWCFLR